MESIDTSELRRCFRKPVPQVFHAAGLLQEAVLAHFLGDLDECERLIRAANDPAVRDYTRPFLGPWRRNPYLGLRKVVDAPPVTPKSARTALRMPTSNEKAKLREKFGHACAFCGIPLIRVEVRKAICRAYPASAIWGRTNDDCHAALLCMWLQYDHVLPHSRGGDNSPSNLVVTCAPCNFGRMSFTLEEVGIADPRDVPPISSTWGGLEEFLTSPRDYRPPANYPHHDAKRYPDEPEFSERIICEMYDSHQPTSVQQIQRFRDWIAINRGELYELERDPTIYQGRIDHLRREIEGVSVVLREAGRLDPNKPVMRMRMS